MKVNPNRLSESKNSELLKIVEPSSQGLNLTNQSRVAIGYVLKGRKTIYCAGGPMVVDSGCLYFIGEGVHYVENVATTMNYEEIIFYVPATLLQDIVMALAESGEIKADIAHRCPRCRGQNVVVASQCQHTFDNFFASVNHTTFRSDISSNYVVRNIRIAELVYFILSNSDECLRSVLLRSCDVEYIQFMRVVYDNLFNDVSIETLARATNRSVTSFKKDFQRYFNMPPHRWYIEQRLIRAKILLLSSEMTISEIGIMCSFTNISHFIKLFKQQFDVTPAALRKMSRAEQDEEPSVESAV